MKTVLIYLRFLQRKIDANTYYFNIIVFAIYAGKLHLASLNKSVIAAALRVECSEEKTNEEENEAESDTHQDKCLNDKDLLLLINQAVVNASVHRL